MPREILFGQLEDYKQLWKDGGPVSDIELLTLVLPKLDGKDLDSEEMVEWVATLEAGLARHNGGVAGWRPEVERDPEGGGPVLPPIESGLTPEQQAELTRDFLAVRPEQTEQAYYPRVAHYVRWCVRHGWRPIPHCERILAYLVHRKTHSEGASPPLTQSTL